MSNSDSFFQEVSEEVRRDKLYALMRKYGWIPVLAVVLIVAAAAWREYSLARSAAEAQARGDAVLAAVEAEDTAAALAGIDAEGDVSAVFALLAAAEDELAGDGVDPERIARLEAVAADPEIGVVYRDLAVIKAVMLSGDTMPAADRIARLSPLTTPGNPFRPVALELTAQAHVAAGETAEALSILTDLVADSEATDGLRQRASQLIVALGGELEAS